MPNLLRDMPIGMDDAICEEMKKAIKWYCQNQFVNPFREGRTTKEFVQALKTVYESKCRFLTLIACYQAFTNSWQTQQAAASVLLEWFGMAQERNRTEENHALMQENEELHRICMVYWRMDEDFEHTDLIETAITRKILRLWKNDSLDYIAARLIEALDKLAIQEEAPPIA